MAQCSHVLGGLLRWQLEQCWSTTKGPLKPKVFDNRHLSDLMASAGFPPKQLDSHEKRVWNLDEEFHCDGIKFRHVSLFPLLDLTESDPPCPKCTYRTFVLRGNICHCACPPLYTTPMQSHWAIQWEVVYKPDLNLSWPSMTASYQGQRSGVYSHFLFRRFAFFPQMDSYK